MDEESERFLPPELRSALERKYFWWEPIGTQPRSDARILAQAMNFASFEEVRRLEAILGQERLAGTMLGSAPGWIGDRSWEFWRGRLARGTGCVIPDAPPRRTLDAELA